MKFLLLTNKPHGVLLNRTPIEVEGDLHAEFEGLPEGEYTAVFVFDGGKARSYRKIVDGVATLERKLLENHYGELFISVKNEDLSKEWNCDGFICSGCRLFPDERSNGELLAELRHEMDVVLTELSTLRNSVENLSERVAEIFDGYDVI